MNSATSISRPEPQQDRRSEIYSSYARNHFSSMYVYDDAEYRRMARKYAFLYKRFLPAIREAAILDVGCGVGHFLNMLEAEGYSNCTGVDISSDAIEICRGKVRSPVFLSDAFAFLESHPGSADFVINMHVLEHLALDDGIAFLKLLCGALRTNGTLVLATPNADCPWAGHCMFDDLTHQRLYTPRTLRQVLLQGGFESIMLYPETPAPYDVQTTARWMASGALHRLRKIAFAIEIGPGRTRRNEIILTPGIIAVAKKKTPETIKRDL